jgi:hypothetical protein
MTYFRFLSLVCVKADAAADFSALVESLLLKIFDAIVATRFDVLSFFDIRFSINKKPHENRQVNVRLSHGGFKNIMFLAVLTTPKIYHINGTNANKLT